MARAEDFFRVMGIKVVTGSRYLGGFFGNMKAEARWMAEKVQVWMESVKTLSGVFCKHPHSTYAGLHNLLQQKWSFMHWITPDIGDAFGLVEQVLRDDFIPALFQGIGEGTLGSGFSRIPMK